MLCQKVWKCFPILAYFDWESNQILLAIVIPIKTAGASS